MVDDAMSCHGYTEFMAQPWGEARLRAAKRAEQREAAQCERPLKPPGRA